MRSCIKRILSVLTVFLTLLSLSCFYGGLVSYGANETIIVTCLDAAPQYEEKGTWYASGLTGYNGGATRYTAKTGASAVFRPMLSKGRYIVSYYRVLNSTSQIASPLTVYHADGETTYNFNGTVGEAGWVGLAYFNFDDGNNGYLEIVSNDIDRNLRASAVKFEKVEDIYPPKAIVPSSVSEESDIIISFYEQIQSVSADAVVLTDDETGEVEECTVSLSDDFRSININPKYNLKGLNTYTLSLKGIKDSYGNESEEQIFKISTTLSGWKEAEEGTDTIGAKIYVSPSGNDKNIGTISSPVKSLERAKSLASEKILTTSGNVNVCLRGGTYSIVEPLTFTYKDSAPDGQKIIYSAYKAEKPVLTTEKAVSGWTEYENGIWKANVGKGVLFRQLYSGDEKLVRSREPDNEESYRLEHEKTSTGFNVKKGVININKFKNDMEIAVENVWMHKRLKIESASDGDTYTKINIEKNIWNDVLTKPQGATVYYGNEYHLENSYDFIDEEGEWYLDETQGVLYLKSVEDPNNKNITYPQSEKIINIEGTISRPVRNLEFSGLTFKRTNWTYPSEYGLNDIQANTLIPSADEIIEDESYRYGFKKEYVKGAVDVKAGFNIAVTNCVFSDMGGNAINFKDGGAHIKVKGNIIYNCAGGAVEIGDDSYRPSHERMRIYNAEISDNLIRNTGTEYFGSVGILVFYADGAKVVNNDIKNTSYSAINVGWGWGNDEYVETARNYTVSGNRIEKFCTKVKDGGAIYAPNPVYGTSVISDNLIVGWENTMRSATMVGGIYHDAFGSNWTDKNNVILSVLDWVMGANEKEGIRYDGKTILLENNYVTSHKKKQALSGEFVSFVNTVQLDGTENLPPEAESIIDKAGLSEEYKNNYSLLPGLFFPEYEIYEGKRAKNGEITLTLADEAVEISAQSNGGVKIYDSVKDGKTVKIPFYVYPDVVASVYNVTVTAQKNGQTQTENIKIAVLDSEEAVYVSVQDSGYVEEQGLFESSGLSGYSGGSRYGYTDYTEAAIEPECSFNAELDEGLYNVYVYRVPHYQNCRQTIVEVVHKYGNTQKIFDFTNEPADWVYAGTYEFDKNAVVKMKRGAGGYLRMSDVKFEKVRKTISDEEGLAINTLKSGEKVISKILLGNYSGENKTYTVYAALYSENGKLLKVERTKYEIISGNEKEFITEIEMPVANLKNCLLKIFVWEETEGKMRAMMSPSVICG